MDKKLIFIGGAPGVGKSTVAELLLNDLQDSVWLDGDDLWRMHPFIVGDNTKAMVERNISFVLNSFIREHFSYIIFTWVNHLDAIVDTIFDGIDQSDFNFMNFTLVCDEKTLKERISKDTKQTRDRSLAINRLRESEKVKSIKVDTVHKTPSDVASAIKTKILSYKRY